MNNLIMNFSKRDVTLNGKKYTVPDYFSKKLDLHDYVNTMPDRNLYITQIPLQNNDKIERIAFSLYGNTKYWDLLVLINNLSTFFDLPLSDEYLSTEAEEIQKRTIENIKQNLTNEDKERISEAIKDSLFDKQDERRYLRIVIPSMLPQFLSLLKMEKYL